MTAHKSIKNTLKTKFLHRIHDSLNTVIPFENTFNIVIHVNFFLPICKINCEDCNACEEKALLGGKVPFFEKKPPETMN